MCGRYALGRPTSELVALFEIDEVGSDLPEPRWNIAPTTGVPIVVEPTPKDDSPPVRRLERARWGLVPGWAKAADAGPPLFNARAETAAEKPTFKAAVERRRALVPADGWFEWQRHDDVKTPFWLHPLDGEPLTFAGLYEWWRQPDGGWLLSTTILTREAVGHLAAVHDRMPMVLTPEFRDTWLDPDTVGTAELVADAAEDAASCVDAITAVEVGSAVGNVRNDGPELIEPRPGGRII